MRYKSKPREIDALQWTGDNIIEIQMFMEDNPPEYVGNQFSNADDLLMIQTLEGPHIANLGDWIIRGIEGEYYPCKTNIFHKLYEPKGIQIIDGYND